MKSILFTLLTKKLSKFFPNTLLGLLLNDNQNETRLNELGEGFKEEKEIQETVIHLGIPVASEQVESKIVMLHSTPAKSRVNPLLSESLLFLPSTSFKIFADEEPQINYGERRQQYVTYKKMNITQVC